MHWHNKNARAYALAVLSCEEFAKSFLYKCLASGFVVDKKALHDLRYHDLKLAHLARILSITQALNSISAELRMAERHDAKFKDHNMHIMPKVYDKLRKYDFMPIINIFKLSGHYKMLAFYVDIKDDRVLEPNFMKRKACHRFLQIVDHYVTGFEVVLPQDSRQFRKRVEVLDPDILRTGKIKINVLRKGRFFNL